MDFINCTFVFEDFREKVLERLPGAVTSEFWVTINGKDYPDPVYITRTVFTMRCEYGEDSPYHFAVQFRRDGEYYLVRLIDVDPDTLCEVRCKRKRRADTILGGIVEQVISKPRSPFDMFNA